jgi:putative membrane protein
LKTPITHWFILCLQGAIVGIAAILPGASGGVFCVAFGIYEPMMALLAHPKKNFRRYYKIFIPFAIGWVAGFLLIAHAAVFLFEIFPEASMALFAGLICGTIPALIKKTYDSNPSQNWSPLIISMVVVFTFLGFLQTEAINSVAPNAAWFVFCGIIWGFSIVIPGLSSSSVLIFLGLYQPMAAGIAGLDAAVLIPMLSGLIITVLLTARLINALFAKHYAFISQLVLGIILSSTLMILPTAFTSIFSVFLSILCFIGGYFAAIKMNISKQL